VLENDEREKRGEKDTKDIEERRKKWQYCNRLKVLGVWQL
jgi:hypothetical protein